MRAAEEEEELTREGREDDGSPEEAAGSLALLMTCPVLISEKAQYCVFIHTVEKRREKVYNVRERVCGDVELTSSVEELRT